MLKHIEYLATVYLKEPRSPELNSKYMKSLKNLIEACQEAGINHHDVIEEILNKR